MKRKGYGFILAGLVLSLAGCGGSHGASTGLDDFDPTSGIYDPSPFPTTDPDDPFGGGIPTPLAVRKASASSSVPSRETLGMRN